MAYLGENQVEWDGNITILQNAHVNLLPLIFKIDNNQIFTTLKPHFPRIKSSVQRIPHLYNADLLEDSRTLQQTEEAVHASNYLQTCIDNNLVDRNQLTRDEDTAFQTYTLLSRNLRPLHLRSQAAKDYTNLTTQLKELESRKHDSTVQAKLVQYKLSKDQNQKETILQEIFDLYTSFSESKARYLTQKQKFAQVVADLISLEGTEIDQPFLSINSYDSTTQIGDELVFDFLHTQEIVWNNILHLGDSDEEHQRPPPIVQQPPIVPAGLSSNEKFLKKITMFQKLLTNIKQQLDTEDTIDIDVLKDHKDHIVNIRNQLETLQCEVQEDPAHAALIEIECPKVIESLGKRISEMNMSIKKSEEEKKQEVAANLRAMAPIKLENLTGYADYLGWYRSQTKLNSHKDPFKKASALLSTLKNPDDIRRCQGIFDYNQLMELLNAKYAKTEKLIPAMINKLRKLETPQTNNQMKSNIDIILNCYTQLKAMNETAVSRFDGTVVEDLVLKLTAEYQTKYEEYILHISDSATEADDNETESVFPDNTIREIEGLQETYSPVDTYDSKIKRVRFIKFLRNTEIVLANMAARSSNLDTNKPKPVQKNCKTCNSHPCKCKKTKVYSTQVTNTSPQTCPICKSSTPHVNKNKKPTKSLASCQQFRKLETKEKVKQLQRLDYCMMCLQPGHKAKDCFITGNCLNCDKGRHNYLICLSSK